MEGRDPTSIPMRSTSRIAWPGRDARHLFLHEIGNGEAHIYGFFPLLPSLPPPDELFQGTVECCMVRLSLIP
jgi:hypothetical protein